MLVQLSAGEIINPDIHTTIQSDRRALLVYMGHFNSLDGPVDITYDHLQHIANNHNERIAKLGDFARMSDYPPIQLDHSRSARDTVGRLIGPVELGVHEGVAALFGQVRILGCDNWEKVCDGRWTHLSINADLEKGKIQELTITPFPAAENAVLLKKGEEMAKKKLEETEEKKDEKKEEAEDEKVELSEDKDEDDKKLAEDEGKKDEEKEETEEEKAKKVELSKTQVDETFEHRGQECKIIWSSLKGDGTDTRYWGVCSDLELQTRPTNSRAEAKSALKKMVEENEKEATGLSAEEEKATKKIEMSAALSTFQSSASSLRLAMRKANISARLSKLKADAKITPAEIKKMNLVELAGSNDQTINAVLKSYEGRQPVIHTGQLGSLKATNAAEIAKECKLSNLEAETRANMPSLSKKDSKKSTRLSSEITEQNSKKVEEVSMSSDHDGMWSEIVKAIQDGDQDTGKTLFMKACKMELGDVSVDDKEIATLMSAFCALDEQFVNVVRLATEATGTKL
jgi:outer membrane biosynthesis protein TonB